MTDFQSIMGRFKRAFITIAVAMVINAAPAQVQDATTQPEPVVPPASAPAARSAADLPDAQSILDNAIEAVGGKAAIEAIKSIAIKATLSTDRGEVQLDLFSAEPDKALVLRHDLHGETQLGSDGTIGWLKPAQGELQILDDMQSDHVQRQSNVYRVLLKVRDDYRDFQTVDRAKFDGADVHKVKMIDHRGKVQFALFDVDSKLIRALLIPEDTPEGERIVTVRFDGWKKHGDILGFTKATIENEKTSVLHLKEVEFNAVDPKVFDPPAEVKALAAEKAATATANTTLPATQPQTSPEDSDDEEGVGEDEEDEDPEGEEPEDEGDDEPEEDDDEEPKT